MLAPRGAFATNTSPTKPSSPASPRMACTRSVRLVPEPDDNVTSPTVRSMRPFRNEPVQLPCLNRTSSHEDEDCKEDDRKKLHALPSACRLTPQFSGRALRCPAHSKRIMNWRACCAPAPTHHGPLQLLVMRHCAMTHSCSMSWPNMMPTPLMSRTPNSRMPYG